MEPADKILTAAETAERLRISIRTLPRLKTLPKIQLSPRRIGYLESAVSDYIGRATVAPPAS